MSSSSSRMRPVARPARAPESKTISGFPTGISGLELTGARVRAGGEVRRADADRQRRDEAGLRSTAVRRADRRRNARRGARADHRDRRRVPEAGARERSRSSKARASTTARRRWKRSCVWARTSSSSAAATPPVRRRCFSRRRPDACTCWSAGDGLAETMSRYLIRRIEDNPAIVLRTHAEIVALDGDGHLNGSGGATTGPAASRHMTSGTCS